MHLFDKLIASIIVGCSCLALATKAQVISVTSIKQSPYLLTPKNRENTSDPFTGFIKDVLDEVAAITPFTFKIQLVEDNQFGAKDENGSFSGMVGEVIDGKADIAAAALTVSAVRRDVVEFSPSIQNFGHVIVMRKPGSLQKNYLKRVSRLFSPFEQSVWLMSLVAYLVTSTVLYVISHSNPYEWRKLAQDGEATAREGETFNCMNSFWFVVSSWFLQGFGSRTPRSLGARTIVFFWWGFVIMFVATYISSLTNLLQHSPDAEEMDGFGRLQSLQDLSREDDMLFGMLRGGSTESYFKSAKIAYLKNIWDRVHERPGLFVDSIYDGVKRVRHSKGEYAFIMESAMAKYYTKHQPCDLYYAGDMSNLGNYAFAYRQGWRHAKALDSAIMKLRENGVMQLLDERWFNGQCESFFVDASTSDSYRVPAFYTVDLGSFGGALIILVIGLVAGSLITGIEICVYRKVELPMRRSRGTDAEQNDASQPALGQTDRSVTKL